jgi:hypothetical protein
LPKQGARSPARCAWNPGLLRSQEHNRRREGMARAHFAAGATASRESPLK